MCRVRRAHGYRHAYGGELALTVLVPNRRVTTASTAEDTRRLVCDPVQTMCSGGVCPVQWRFGTAYGPLGKI